MRKSQLCELIKAINILAPEEIPIIVGSQAVHAAGRMTPEIVQQSIECDFLLTGGKSETRIAINKKLGVFSQYQIENGFYADALGLATVVLPTAGTKDCSLLKMRAKMSLRRSRKSTTSPSAN